MYGELEQMVAQDMMETGYDPENELDIQDYWSYRLPLGQTNLDEALDYMSSIEELEDNKS